MAADTDQLQTIGDLIRWGGSRFRAAGLCFGHGTEDAFDEAAWLVGHALHLPFGRIAGFQGCRVLPAERDAVLALLQQRIDERRPAAYLTGRAWFAGLELLVDDAVMIPRSPMAELIEAGFTPWCEPDDIGRVLDLCTGSGCIGLAAAAHLPAAEVDLADISPAALRVAAQNRGRLGLEARTRLIESDLFAGIGEAGDGAGYDLILSNPPYVGAEELEALPAEYRHEPRLAFAAGDTGLDLVLRILRDAPDYLADDGQLICEVGNTSATLEQHLPDVPFTWLDFERGGDGVFLLCRAELAAHHRRFAEALAAL